jgi:hypothetical protein
VTGNEVFKKDREDFQGRVKLPWDLMARARVDKVVDAPPWCGRSEPAPCTGGACEGLSAC